MSTKVSSQFMKFIVIIDDVIIKNQIKIIKKWFLKVKFELNFILFLLNYEKILKINIKTIIINGYHIFHEIASKEFQVIFFSAYITHGKNRLTNNVILESKTIFHGILKIKLLNQKILKIFIIFCLIFLSFHLSL